MQVLPSKNRITGKAAFLRPKGLETAKYCSIYMYYHFSKDRESKRVKMAGSGAEN